MTFHALDTSQSLRASACLQSSISLCPNRTAAKSRWDEHIVLLWHQDDGVCIEWGSECSENRQARWTKNIDAEVNIRKDQPPVSVVIVKYNAGLFLTECVHSALPQVSEVLVVDNSSTDLSLDLCIQSFPEEHRLKIIRNSTNLGFAAGCNLGIAQATGAYMLFLNPDCGNNGG